MSARPQNLTNFNFQSAQFNFKLLLRNTLLPSRSIAHSCFNAG